MTWVDRRLPAVLLCLLLASGCASLTDVKDLGARVDEAGYTSVSVHHHSHEGFDTLTVVAGGGPEEDNNGEDIARIVWDTYPADVDELRLELNGKRYKADTARLEELFGPRRIRPDDSSGNAVLESVIGVAVFLLLIAGVVAIFVARRRKRRRQAFPEQYPDLPYPQYRQQQPGSAQPGSAQPGTRQDPPHTS